MNKFLLKLKNFKKKKMIIISIVIIAVSSIGVLTYSKLNSKNTTAAATYTSSTVQRGDVSLKISGSGTVEPISKYEIISLVKGEILSSAFEEGDYVKSGDVLYRIDSTDLQNNIQKQHNNIASKQLTAKSNADNIASLKVKAPASGTLTDFSLKVNDTARTEKIATIIDSESLIATIPFNSSQLSQIRIRDNVTVTSALYMTTISGTVTHKSTVPSGSSDGSTLYDVEITLRNPGSLTSGISVGATVHTASGDVKSPASGKIENGEITSVIPKVAGKITKIYVRNNQHVNEGDVLFQIDDTDYIQAQTRTNIELQDLQLSLQSYTKDLDNYNITSPIDGVVLSKSYKVGDIIGNSQNSSASLMTVADTSKMVFKLDVDELEITKVKVGQLADITADALPNNTFLGKVTNIAKEGSSSNGVTTYKVELTIDEPANLMSGMNVNAEIIVEQSKDTLLVPLAAVTNIRNGQGTVLVKADSSIATSSDEGQNQRPSREGLTEEQRTSMEGMTDEQRQAMRENMQRQRGEAGQEGSQRQRGEAGQGGSQRQSREAEQESGSSRTANTSTINSSEEYRSVRVTTGLSDSNNIEIKSGLNEGDEIFIAATSSSTRSTNNRTNIGVGGMGGNMGGGAPAMRMR